ncbi:MAG: hypothetical protein IJA78_05975 [Clostridia bacterium]|nr:hypothetical protein [Clostridia bacterium]
MKKTVKKDRSRLIVRIVAIVLAALMVAGVAYYTVVMIRYEIERKRLEEEILSQIGGDDDEGHEH